MSGNKKEAKTSMVLHLKDSGHLYARKLKLEREVEGVKDEAGKKETLPEVVTYLIDKGIESEKKEIYNSSK